MFCHWDTTQPNNSPRCCSTALQGQPRMPTAACWLSCTSSMTMHVKIHGMNIAKALTHRSHLWSIFLFQDKHMDAACPTIQAYMYSCYHQPHAHSPPPREQHLVVGAGQRWHGSSSSSSSRKPPPVPLFVLHLCQQRLFRTATATAAPSTAAVSVAAIGESWIDASSGGGSHGARSNQCQEAC